MTEGKKMTGDKSSAGTQDVVQCSDVNCPIHGNLRIHGRRLAGVVASAKMRRTASLVIERTVKIAKYDRYERRRSSINAHNPECISAREGELVEIVECRPLSKTKHFVIVRRVQ